jgi:ATP-dependent DNA helicase RecG
VRVARLAALTSREPSDARLTRLVAQARAAREEVPEERRADWDKLVAQLPKDDSRRKERLLALGRACALFAPPAPPIDVAAPVDAVPGLGLSAREALAEHGIATVFDLLWTLPTSFDDLRHPVGIEEAVSSARAALERGEPAARTSVCGVVKSASLVPLSGRRFVQVILRDEGKATLTASWFFAAHGVLAVAKPGSPCLVTGRIRIDDRGRARMAHPDLVREDGTSAGQAGGVVNPGTTRRVRPRYPRLGVPEGTLRKSVATALERALREPWDPVPLRIAERESMPPARELLLAVHAYDGSSVPSDALRRAALERLAFAEAFTRALQRIEADARGGEAPVLSPNRAALARLKVELGFELTTGQNEAIATIAKDLASPTPMRRLLLGDVGTGKTAVALAAAAQCVSAGYQVAILAPTGVLAEQYMDAVGPLARATGASVALVAAGAPRERFAAGAPRERLLSAIGGESPELGTKGPIQVVVGTHALLGEGVRFARLGLVVVDEQHRLGVAQRVALVRKGGRPHLLTLSATPIPRTLALALRGELKTSTLAERPRGRPPVETVVLPEAERPRVLDELREAAARGERAFLVCPRITPSEDDEDDGRAVPSAEATAKELARALRVTTPEAEPPDVPSAPVRVALLHGGQKSEEQKRAMRAFRRGEAQILVATTVVEVGVDVPEATRIVVLGAERFGMAQLHQLRGRVGRGDKPGRCILLHGPLDPIARRRLDAVRALATGEEIARADLALRGAGDLGGTRQSGVEEELLYLDPASPPAWLERIDKDARETLARDPGLTAPEHRGLALSVARFKKALSVRDEAG